MVIPHLIGNPYNEYIKPYYWVAEPSPIIWIYFGSLDPSSSHIWSIYHCACPSVTTTLHSREVFFTTKTSPRRTWPWIFFACSNSQTTWPLNWYVISKKKANFRSFFKSPPKFDRLPSNSQADSLGQFLGWFQKTSPKNCAFAHQRMRPSTLNLYLANLRPPKEIQLLSSKRWFFGGAWEVIRHVGCSRSCSEPCRPSRPKAYPTEIHPPTAGQYLIFQMLAKLASNDPCSFNPKNPHFLFPQLSPKKGWFPYASNLTKPLQKVFHLIQYQICLKVSAKVLGWIAFGSQLQESTKKRLRFHLHTETQPCFCIFMLWPGEWAEFCRCSQESV